MHLNTLTVVGTRPETIKMAPLVQNLAQDNRFESRICVPGQHRQILDQALQLFEITPHYDLSIMKPGQDLTDVTTAILQALKPCGDGTARSRIIATVSNLIKRQ